MEESPRTKAKSCAKENLIARWDLSGPETQYTRDNLGRATTRPQHQAGITKHTLKDKGTRGQGSVTTNKTPTLTDARQTL